MLVTDEIKFPTRFKSPGAYVLPEDLAKGKRIAYMGFTDKDGEIRCGFNHKCVAIPCTLRIVNKMSDLEIVTVAEKYREAVQ